MPKSTLTKPNFAPGSSRLPRSARTFALQMALAAERQAEIAARLRELRGPRPQQQIADAVGVTLRALQAWEAGDSGLRWENLSKLARHFGVSEDYILTGADDDHVGAPAQEAATVDLDDVVARLERIEQMLSQLLAREQATDQETSLQRAVATIAQGVREEFLPKDSSTAPRKKPAARRAS